MCGIQGIYPDRLPELCSLIREFRIIWPDSANTGFDGYLYFNINQLPYQPSWNNGTDLRQHPGLILRTKLPNNGTKSGVLIA